MFDLRKQWNRACIAEPSLVINAEPSGPKLPLCPSCAQNMLLIRRTQRFGTLPDVCTFECRGCGVFHFEEYEPPKAGRAGKALLGNTEAREPRARFAPGVPEFAPTLDSRN
jgi:hypothetical protein